MAAFLMATFPLALPSVLLYNYAWIKNRCGLFSRVIKEYR